MIDDGTRQDILSAAQLLMRLGRYRHVGRMVRTITGYPAPVISRILYEETRLEEEANLE